MSLVKVAQPRPLAGERPGVIASIEVGEERHDIWYRVSEGSMATGAEPFLAATLASAMMLGRGLEIPGGVSPRLMNALPTIQTILRSWIPRCREVPVSVGACRASEPISSRAVGCFFSGGVDSFYTLLKHRSEITKIILIHGFDMRLDDTHMRAKVSKSLGEVAAELHLALVEVETNLRSFADRYAPWRFYHGSMLASVALLLAPQIRKVYVPASDSYATLIPWGTHPLLDPLWSTEETQLVHDGLEANRLQKVSSIVSSEVALRHLRVCFASWESDQEAYNCARCAKCLITMVCLRSAGALGQCTTFPPVLDLAVLERLPPPNEAHRLEAQEILRCVDDERDLDLARALRWHIAGRYHHGIRSIPRRALRKMRRLTLKSLDKVRHERAVQRAIHTVIQRLTRSTILGRSPVGAYLRLNERLWERLPDSLTASRPGTAYGHLMNALVRRYARRTQYLGTYFFRNRPELELLRRVANQPSKDRTLKMAVLGCSNGPEVYSIMWAIRSRQPDFKVIIHAVDIVERVLEEAQEGVYPLGVCELVGEPLLERVTEEEMRNMFDKEGHRLRIKAWMKDGISWHLGDAGDPKIVDVLGRQGVVVANRFLCHMEPVEAERCLRNIARLAEPAGYLFVSGIDPDVRTKVAEDLAWKPVYDLLEAIHDGDPSLRRAWPWRYWGLEPLDRTRRDWILRYASVFQLGEQS